MGVIVAEEVLRDRGGDLTPESLRSLMLRAGASEGEADDAYCERVFEVERG